MRAQRREGTGPELALRSELHRRGLRYRVQASLVDKRRRHDIVFPRARVVVEVHGCFWHACPLHGSLPRTNREWWASKLRANQERDARSDRALEAAGWQVVVVWEHEDAVEAADRIERLVRERSRRSS